MAVYFVYRCDQIGIPTGLFVRRFPDGATLADWFRGNWREHPDYSSAQKYAHELLGVPVFMIATLFLDLSSSSQTPPESLDDLREAFERT